MTAKISTYYLVGNKLTIDRDADARLDYSMNMSKWLEAADPAGDTLQSAEVVEQVGVHTVAFDGTAWTPSTAVEVFDSGRKWRVWVSGGTAGEPASVTVRFTTAGRRVDDRTIHFKVVGR